MHKYDITDFQPNSQDLSTSQNDTEDVDIISTPDDTHTMEQLDLSPEQIDTKMTSNVIDSTPSPSSAPKWSRYVSALFSPLLIPSYTVALIMWITPLSENPESVRFLSTLMVFIITAIAPMSYILTMVGLKRFKSADIPDRRHRFEPAVVTIICIVLSVLYLDQINAPDWLMMVPATYGICTAVYIILNTWKMVSGHAMNMGAFTGIILFLCSEGLIDFNSSLCVASCVLLSGLVCSARMTVGHHTITDVSLGAGIGIIIGFIAMFLPLL